MIELPSILEKMKRIIQFKDFSDKDLHEIIKSGVIKRYQADKTIYFEEDPCFGLCVLLKGEVHLYKLGPEGQENIISVIKPVIMFNEIAAIDGGINPETAIAFKNSIIWRTDHQTFQNGLKFFPELGIGLLPILARRNRRLISKYADLSFRPVRERVALLLLELSNEGEIEIVRKDHAIQQMAAHIVTSPVVISRILGEFKEEGLIECCRSTILVFPEKLFALTLIDYEPVMVCNSY